MQNNKTIKTIRNAAVTFFVIAAGALTAFAGIPSNDDFANAEVLTGARVSVTRSNFDSTKEPGEPNHAFNVGGSSVWFKYTAPSTAVMLFSTGRSQSNFDSTLHVYVGNSVSSLFSRTFNNDISPSVNRRSAIRTEVQAGTVYYIAIDGFNSGSGAATGVFTLDIIPSNMYQGSDVDGDGLTDLSVFRPSEGNWYALGSGSGEFIVRHYGTSGDIPVVASRTTARTFPTVFRPGAGLWYGYIEGENSMILNWGLPGDIPLADTFGGEGSSDYTVFRPSTGDWYIYGYGIADRYYHFGLEGDVPVPGRYSPDSTADLAVFRPSTGVWYILRRLSGNPNDDSFRAVQFGQAGDKPVPGDYDGDGILDLAIYRPSTGTWWVLRSSDNQQRAFQWGLATDVPTTGDFDGDGIFDFAVFRPSTGDWYILNSMNQNVKIMHFGVSSDIPMTSNLRY